MYSSRIQVRWLHEAYENCTIQEENTASHDRCVSLEKLRRNSKKWTISNAPISILFLLISISRFLLRKGNSVLKTLHVNKYLTCFCSHSPSVFLSVTLFSLVLLSSIKGRSNKLFHKQIYFSSNTHNDALFFKAH